MQKGFLALMSAALLFSCSSIEPFEMESEDVLLSSGTTACITDKEDTWQIRSATFQATYQNGGIAYVRVYNSPTKIFYEFSSSTTINSISVNGQTISGLTYSENLPPNWDGTTVVNNTFAFTRSGAGGGGGNATSVVTSYTLTPMCPPAECIIVNESAYVGDTRGENDPGSGQGNNNAWWYAFDVTGDATQSVYQNGNEVGQATLANGIITISLINGWSLSGGESVKWYSYAEGDLPTEGRPTPGQAPNKGSSLSIQTSSDQYYVIHLDIQREICN